MSKWLSIRIHSRRIYYWRHSILNGSFRAEDSSRVKLECLHLITLLHIDCTMGSKNLYSSYWMLWITAALLLIFIAQKPLPFVGAVFLLLLPHSTAASSPLQNSIIVIVRLSMMLLLHSFACQVSSLEVHSMSCPFSVNLVWSVNWNIDNIADMWGIFPAPLLRSGK